MQFMIKRCDSLNSLVSFWGQKAARRWRKSLLVSVLCVSSKWVPFNVWCIKGRLHLFSREVADVNSLETLGGNCQYPKGAIHYCRYPRDVPDADLPPGTSHAP